VTRGTRVEDAGHLSSFGVSAIKTNTNVSAEQFAAATPDFFYNLQATKNTNDVFEIAQDYYWPTSDEKLFFYAYTPYGNNKVQISDQSAGGAQKVMLTVDTDVENQVDLMTASAETTAFNSASGNQKKSSVGLNFKHELTAIRFVIGEQWLAGRIKSVGIYNVHGKGTMTIGADDASKWEWKNMDGTQSYSASDDFVLTVNKSGLNGTNNEQFIDDENLYFLMIPQSFDGNDDAYIEVKYQDLTYEYTVTAPLKGMAAWQRNTTVTYAISSHELTKLKIGSIAWPDESGDKFKGVKTSFANGDAVGLYVVDTNGTDILHYNVQCTYNNGSWTVHHPTNNPVYKLPGRQYFFYYPYTSTPDTKYPVGGQGTTDTAADAFFAPLINGWEPVLLQNGDSPATLNAQDLQVGKGIDHATIASTINATMAHQMNIAVFTLGTTYVPEKGYKDACYHLSTDANYKWVHTSTYDVVDDHYAIVASSKFTGNTRPYKKPASGTTPDTYYYVFKPVSNNQAGTDLAAVQADNVTVDWSENYKTAERGKKFVKVVESKRTEYVSNRHVEISNNSYTLAVGDVFYSNGALSHTLISASSNACYPTAIGLVYSLSTSAKDKQINANYKHGSVISLTRRAANNSNNISTVWAATDSYAATHQMTDVMYWYNNASQQISAVLGDKEGLTHCRTAMANSHYSECNAMIQASTEYSATYPTPSSCSGWFLPSTGQIFECFSTFCASFPALSEFTGGVSDNSSRNFGVSKPVKSTLDAEFKKHFTDAGFSESQFDGLRLDHSPYYYASTEASAEIVYTLDLHNNDTHVIFTWRAQTWYKKNYPDRVIRSYLVF
nr:fimbrillin family protein [Prevotella sp.]